MNKSILILIGLLVSTLSWSQYAFESITSDPVFCNSDSKTYILKVTHPTSSPSIVNLPSSNSNNGNLFISMGSSLPDSTHVGAGIDTSFYTVYVSTNGTVPANDVATGEEFTIDINDELGYPEASTDVTGLTVYGPVDVYFDLGSSVVCANGQAVDLFQFVTIPGGEFYFFDDAPASNIFNPAQYYDNTSSTGVYFEYVVTNVAGCTGDIPEALFDLTLPPTVMISTNPSSCGLAIGDAAVNITPGDDPGNMEVYWSNGFLDPIVATISSISGLSSGVYYANVTDASGCKAVGVAEIGDVDIVVTDVVTTPSCSGMNDGTIDLTVTTGGNITQTFWSNGITTEDMVGNAGEYSVEIHTDNGCSTFGTYIIPENDLWLSLVFEPAPVDCFIPGNSFVDIDTGSTAGITSLVWENALGTTVATTADFNPMTAGVFTCTLTDNNGCTFSEDITIESSSNAGMGLNTITSEDCGLSNGAIDVELYWGTVSSYLWSNGETTQDISGLEAGDYTLEFVDDGGCSNYLTATVLNVKPYQPQICLLTVDTSLVYNEVVWEKDPSNIVDGYNIYRETSNYGVFALVTSLPYSHESDYIDNAASPVDRSWRYFITSYDACGESIGSAVHKTIHIVVTNNNGTDVDLAWDDYEGITYSSIDLMRFDETNGWQTVANLPIGTNTYTDTPPVTLGLDYMISFILSSPCTSTKAQDHNASRSNTSTSTYTAGEPTDLSVIEKEDGKIILYPNPTSDNLNIYIENADDYDVIRIVNINGELVYTQTISESLNQISTMDFAKGIYFVQIYSENGIVTEKIVKQ